MHFGDKDTGIPLEQVEQLKARYPEVGIYVYDRGCTASVTAAGRRTSTKRPAGAWRGPLSSSTSISPDLYRHLVYLEAEMSGGSRGPAFGAQGHALRHAGRRLCRPPVRCRPSGGRHPRVSCRACTQTSGAPLDFDVAAGRCRLVTEAVEVPIASYGELRGRGLHRGFFYNGHTVQRVRNRAPGQRASLMYTKCWRRRSSHWAAQLWRHNSPGPHRSTSSP